MFSPSTLGNKPNVPLATWKMSTGLLMRQRKQYHPGTLLLGPKAAVTQSHNSQRQEYNAEGIAELIATELG